MAKLGDMKVNVEMSEEFKQQLEKAKQEFRRLHTELTDDFKKLIAETVHAELAKLEAPMDAHIAGEITRQLDERKHAKPAQLHGLKPHMEVK